MPFIVLVLGVAAQRRRQCATSSPPFNLSLVLQQVTIIGILGIAQTLIILTAGIDLSVGAIMVLSSVVMGRLAVVAGVPIIVAFPARPAGRRRLRLRSTASLVTRLKLPPFIVTLGTWSIFGALNLFYSQQRDHPSAGHRGARRRSCNSWASRSTFGGARDLCLGSILMIALGGRRLVRAQPHGLRPPRLRHRRRSRGGAPRRHQHRPHAAQRLCRSPASSARRRLGADRPHRRDQPAPPGENANLDSITAVVIGGTSLFGGRGSIVGTLIGALIVGVFRSGSRSPGSTCCGRNSPSAS